MLSILRNLTCLLIAASLAACGGAHTADVVPSGSGAGAPTHKSSKMLIRVKIPKRFHHKFKKYFTYRDPKSHAMTRKLTPEYISAATTSLTFQLYEVNGSTTIPSGFTPEITVNLSTGCTLNAGEYDCSTSWVVPVGTDEFAVAADDASSNLLSYNTLTQAVPAGNSNLSITLYGIPAHTVVIPYGYLTGSNPTFSLPSAPLLSYFLIYTTDADGYAIPADNQFNFLSPSGSFTYTQPSGNEVTVTPTHARTSLSGGFTVQLNSAAVGYPYACPNATCEDAVTFATATPPKSILAAEYATNTIQVWAGSDIDTVLLTGASNVAPTGSLTASCSSAIKGLYMDSSGNLFARCNSGTIDVFSAAQVQSAATTTGVTRSGQLSCSNTSDSPTGVACGIIKGLTRDSGGNVFADDGTTGLWIWNNATVSSALSGSTGLQATAGISSMTSGPNMSVMARDSVSGNLLIANSGGSQTSVCSGGPYDGTYMTKAALNTAIVNGTFTAKTRGCWGKDAQNPAWTDDYEMILGDGSGDYTFADGSYTTGCPCSYFQAEAYSTSNISAWSGTCCTGYGQNANYIESLLGESATTLGLIYDSSGNVFGNDFNNPAVYAYTSTCASKTFTGTACTGNVGTWVTSNAVNGGLAYDSTFNYLAAGERTGSLIQILSSSGLSAVLGGSTTQTSTGSLAASSPLNIQSF